MGIVTALLGVVLILIGGKAPEGACTPPLTGSGRIAAISAESHTVALALPDGSVKTFSSSSLGNALLSLGPGDTVCFSDNTKQPDQLEAIAVELIAVGWSLAIGALLLAFATVWLVMLAITQGHPWGFALGLDKRLSNSQMQIYLWFFVLATVYLSELGLRLRYAGALGGISVPTNLLALAGISAFTFGTARLNTMAKTSGAVPLSGQKQPETGELRRRDLLRHLFTNDSGFADLGDMQMIVLTAITGIVYVGISATFLARVSLSGHIDLPPVDDTLLGGTAVSQGAYLFKKLGSKPGD